MENESFPDLHRWEQFSSALQRYQYWLGRAQEPRLSYLQLKESTEAFTRCPDRDRGTNWKYRLALGAALLGNGYFAYIPQDPDAARECGYVDPTLRGIVAELDEYKAGSENRWHYLGRPLGDARRLTLPSGQNLLANGSFETDLSGARLATTGQSEASLIRDVVRPGQGQASLKVAITQLDSDPADVKLTVNLGPFSVERAREYTLRLQVRAEPGYGRVSPIFSGVPRRVSFRLRVAGVPTTSEAEQDVIGDAEWRAYSLSFVAAASDPAATIIVQLGREGGDVWLDSLEFSPGGSDVFYRRFQQGVVLVNGSTGSATFDLASIAPEAILRRIPGTQDRGVNSGECVPSTVTLPGRDALILLDDSAASATTCRN
jgi:hypothetical protein